MGDDKEKKPNYYGGRDGEERLEEKFENPRFEAEFEEEPLWYGSPNRPMAPIQCADVMEKAPHWVGPDSSIEEVVRLMIGDNTSVVPVCHSDGSFLGVVSQLGLVRQVLLQPSPERQTAKDVSNPDPPFCEPLTDLEQVLELMTSVKFSRLPVLHEGKLVGLVTFAGAAKVAKWDQDTKEEMEMLVTLEAFWEGPWH